MTVCTWLGQRPYRNSRTHCHTCNTKKNYTSQNIVENALTHTTPKYLLINKLFHLHISQLINSFIYFLTLNYEALSWFGFHSSKPELEVHSYGHCATKDTTTHFFLNLSSVVCLSLHVTTRYGSNTSFYAKFCEYYNSAMLNICHIVCLKKLLNSRVQKHLSWKICATFKELLDTLPFLVTVLLPFFTF